MIRSPLVTGGLSIRGCLIRDGRKVGFRGNQRYTLGWNVILEVLTSLFSRPNLLGVCSLQKAETAAQPYGSHESVIGEA